MTHNVETKITKHPRDGWMARAEYPIEKLADGSERTLAVTTYKGSWGLVTTFSAGVNKPQEGGRWMSRETFIFQDYNNRVDHPEVKRVTDNTVEAAHKKAIENNLETCLAECRKQYGLTAGWDVVAV